MKKLVIAFVLSACVAALPAKAQDYMFVGLYRAPKLKTACSEVQMMQIAAFSEKEAKEIKKRFLKEHGTRQEGTRILGPNSKVTVVYEYEKEEKAFNCTTLVKGFRDGKPVAGLQAGLDDEYQKNPKKYRTKPAIIFVWDGKKK